MEKIIFRVIFILFLQNKFVFALYSQCNVQQYIQHIKIAKSHFEAGKYYEVYKDYTRAQLSCPDSSLSINKYIADLLTTIEVFQTELKKKENQIKVINEINEKDSKLFANYISQIYFRYILNLEKPEKAIEWAISNGKINLFDTILIKLAKNVILSDNAAIVIKQNLIDSSINVPSRINLIKQIAKIDKDYTNNQVVNAQVDSSNNKFENLNLILSPWNAKNDKLLVAIAKIYRNNKNYIEALKILNMIILNDSINENALLELSYNYYSQDKYDSSYIYTKKLIKYYPFNYIYQFNHSFFSLFVLKPKESITSANTTLELYPDAHSVNSNLALGYILDNNFEEAKKIYVKYRGLKFKDTDEPCNEVFMSDLRKLINKNILDSNYENTIKNILNKN
ncbi:MAG: hypothetical protein IPP04_01210 [Saprospiraceae bacterium]|nr:hypothetical protein [Saprospiraceae bacterium]